MKKFILLTTARTGSTFIRIWLNYHPQIRSHGELLLGHYIAKDGFRHHCREQLLGCFFHSFYRHRILRKLGINFIPSLYVKAFLDSLYNNLVHPRPCISSSEDFKPIYNRQLEEIVGFKLMYDHYRATPEIEDMLNREKVYVLHLLRRNLLKQYTSMVRMKQTGKSHTVSKEKKPHPVYISAKKFMKHIEKQRQDLIEFRKLIFNQPHYEFYYEDFFSDRESCKRDIISFLEVEPQVVKQPNLKRTSTNNIINEISNYQEVISLLKDSSYEYFLNDYKLP